MDMEKVIKGLEFCEEYFNCCDKCPYWDGGTHCTADLAHDALALLKEQEDLGTELTNAVELIHKKNERIEKLLKEQEAVKPRVSSVEQRCGNCNKVIEMDGWITCPWCGKPINWEGWWKKNGTRNQDT